MRTFLMATFGVGALLSWAIAICASIAKHYDVAAAHWGDATFHLIAFCMARFWPKDGQP